jgi:PAS domain S-box-containing protein
MATAENLHLRNLLDAAPDGFIVVDAAGSIVWANQTAHALFGYRDVELIGRLVEDLVPGRLQSMHTDHRAAYQSNPHGRSMGLGLSNIRKHAAASVLVSLSYLNGRGRLEVRDNGNGFNPTEQPPEGHYGMRNMTTRARAIGARLELTSAAGSGTRLLLDFPSDPAG